MKTPFHSRFKDIESDQQWFKEWIERLEKLNGKKYEQIFLDTSIGKTHVFALNKNHDDKPTLVIFPGARTTALFWDFNNNLNNLGHDFRIFLIETNGLPNLSDGKTPNIKSNGYGEWATEVMDLLKIKSAYVAGSSFGGLVTMKLAIVSPEKIKAAFLFNAGCLQTFSMSFKNLYSNLYPIFFPSRKSVKKFLENAVFFKPHHQLSPEAEELFIDYEIFAIKRYRDLTQKPYNMKDELKQVKVPTYVVQGDKDLLFPWKKSVQNAREKIATLKEIEIFENVGHGIETYGKALKYMGDKIVALEDK